MKLWTPDVPDPRLIDAERERGQWDELLREIYLLDNYACGGCKVEPGDVCVDVGANIGVWSRYACARGAARVFAYEPERHNYDCLMLNTDGLPVQPVLRAVTSDPGPVTLFCGNAIGGHTIVNLDRGDNPLTVYSTTLDLVFTINHLTRIDFLKIDCEGAEVGVFVGLSDDNLGRVRKLALEYHHWLEQFQPGAMDYILGRVYDSFLHVECRVNPGGEQTMIYCWR